jgi:hypothetical protein
VPAAGGVPHRDQQSGPVGVHVKCFGRDLGERCSGSLTDVGGCDLHGEVAVGLEITEFIRYRVTPDGTVTVATTTLGADGHAQPSPVLTCEIGHGAEFNTR